MLRRLNACSRTRTLRLTPCGQYTHYQARGLLRKGRRGCFAAFSMQSSLNWQLSTILEDKLLQGHTLSALEAPVLGLAPTLAPRGASCTVQLVATVAGVEDAAGAAASACTSGWLCQVPTPAAAALGLLVAAAIAWKLLGRGPARPLGPNLEPRQVGDITLRTLANYGGKDPFRQTLVAIRGKVLDVSKARNELFAPGRPLHAYAGQEISRALAKDSTLPEDCNDRLEDLSAEETARLQQEEEAYTKEYTVVGQVVPLQRLSLAELAQFGGVDPTKPMYLAIRGVVYDITTGKMYYGPNGIYPFAGREVARAFALNSLKDSDCTANLDGLTRGDMNNLAEWEAKFNYKYPIIGLVHAEGTETWKETVNGTGASSVAAT